MNTNYEYDFSLENLLEAKKQMDVIHASHAMKQAELNLDFLGSRCGKCGHLPKVQGGMFGGQVLICQHQLEWIKTNVPKAEETKSPYGMPTWIRSMSGLEILLVEEGGE